MLQIELDKLNFEITYYKQSLAIKEQELIELKKQNKILESLVKVLEVKTHE